MYSIVTAPKVEEDYAEIFLFGDSHYGAKAQDRKLIRDGVKYVLHTPNCFAVKVGDILDNSLLGKFGIIGESKSVADSLADFKLDFMPLIKEGKFLGAVPGNHDMRISKSLGSYFDPVEQFLGEYDIAYGCPHLIIWSSVGRSGFLGFVTHGSGGGGTLGAVANSMIKSTNEISDADWYAQGHFHQEIIAPSVIRPWFDKKSQKVQSQKQLFISTGSNLKKDGYAAIARLRNGGTSNTIISLTAAPRSNHDIPKSMQTRSFQSFSQAMREKELLRGDK